MIQAALLRTLWQRAVPYVIGAAILAYGAVAVYFYQKGVDNCHQRQAEYALEEAQKKNVKLQDKAVKDRQIAEQQVGKLKDIEAKKDDIYDQDAPPMGCTPSDEWLRYIGAEADHRDYSV